VGAGTCGYESRKAGKHYYITFMDDKTHLTHSNLLHLKSEAFDSYKEYKVWCDTHLDACIKVFHSDRGGEYLGKEFITYLKSKGTAQKLTVHDTPQHNSVAECHNHTIMEQIHALLHSGCLPKMLWGEAAHHVVWLMNHTSTKAVDGMMPYEAAFGKKPDLRHVQEWGEKVWVCIKGGDKLGGHVKEGRWLGVDEQSKGFHIYWPDKWTVMMERNVYYDKTCSSACHLEGEDWEFVKTKTDAPSMPENPTPTTPPAIPSPTTSCALSPSPSNQENPPDEQPIPAKRVRKPSQRVRNILEGRGTTSACPSDPIIAAGVQIPPTVKEAPRQVLEGEGLAD
jgi:hypothetical protein